ncbi:helix-turn-helix domain-containing protein [Amycolatopsis sp. A133]|uniref:TetR/AcrR family transcriptional regulator n=1 Tax=Amycolatopsis sp. A133 TaxID=3064472 RepID=UPI0027ECAB93|nr:helix-turn-helix domain-containing protein [Amycolatopsis sp. A133]MDQ7809784.1 helix-turn-helix domain-containing protein [Amycolatopsis sp. A133]
MAKGRYHSPRRLSAAAATRAAILDSARDLYIERGYVNVTVAQIASAAGVAPQTVYSSTGGKAEILRELLVPAVHDPNAGRTLSAVAQSDDPGEVIDLTARGTRLAHEAHWEMLEALVPECRTEPIAAAVLEAGNAQYAAALATIAARLIELNALRPGVAEDTVADVLWFYVGQDAWFSLVSHRRWSFDDAERWLAAEAKRALLACPGT